MRPPPDLSNASDQDVVAWALQDREEGYRELFTRYQVAVYQLIYRRVCDAAQAEDLTQATFFKAFRALASFNPESSFEPWLLTIARNTAVDHLRCRQIKTLSLDGSPMADTARLLRARALQVAAPIDSTPTPRPRINRRRFKAALNRAIRRLPPNYRRCFVLHDIKELPYDEVAELVDLPVETVRTYTHRARKSVGETLLPLLDSLYQASNPTHTPV